MILLFLAIYLAHFAAVLVLLWYFFTDWIVAICFLSVEWGYEVVSEQRLLSFSQIEEFLVGQHVFGMFMQKNYADVYFYPLHTVVHYFGRKVFMVENIFLTLVVIFIGSVVTDNLKSYYRFTELIRNLRDVEEVCPICLQDLITPNEEAERISCGHYFHNSCLSKWIMSQAEFVNVLNLNQPLSCPLCRKPL